jgi:hypothetical protein
MIGGGRALALPPAPVSAGGDTQRRSPVGTTTIVCGRLGLDERRNVLSYENLERILGRHAGNVTYGRARSTSIRLPPGAIAMG